MIELTVGMPLLSAKNVAWIAMEGLCHQEDIEFDWELIIIEESNDLKFGLDEIIGYFYRLREVGCKRIIYQPLNHWITLGEKYIRLNNLASMNSNIFALQDADVYSPKKWLSLSMQNYPYGWFCSPQGYYYNMFSNILALHIPANPDQAAIYNSMEAKCWHHLNPDKNKKYMYCNGWLYNIVKEQMGKYFERVIDESLWWQTGVNMHGFNIISKGRSKSIDGLSNHHLWKLVDNIKTNLYTIIPEDVHLLFKHQINKRLKDIKKNGDDLKFAKIDLHFKSKEDCKLTEIYL